jgi:hypothetical protein
VTRTSIGIIVLLVVAVLGYVCYDMGLLGRVQSTGGSASMRLVTPLPDSMLGRKFLLDWEVEGEGSKAMLQWIHKVSPDWLMNGDEAAAERIVRDTFTEDMPDNLADAIGKTFSPRMKVVGKLDWKTRRKFEFSGNIYLTYGNDEAELEFSHDMECHVFGLLPAKFVADDCMRWFGDIFARGLEDELAGRTGLEGLR